MWRFYLYVRLYVATVRQTECRGAGIKVALYMSIPNFVTFFSPGLDLQCSYRLFFAMVKLHGFSSDILKVCGIYMIERSWGEGALVVKGLITFTRFTRVVNCPYGFL